MNPIVYCLILAAGNSSRMGGKDKIFEKLSNKKEVIINTIYRFDKIKDISNIIIMTRHDVVDNMKQLINRYNFNKQIFITSGGSTRTKSLFNGFNFIKQNFKLTNYSYCLVHDGARPLVMEKEILKCLRDAIKYRSAAIGIKVYDTVKRSDNLGFISKTIDRSNLFFIQTPQIFHTELLDAAIKYAKDNDLDFTDDCQLLEAIGEKIYISEGSNFNMKITTQRDLGLINYILKNISMDGDL